MDSQSTAVDRDVLSEVEATVNTHLDRLARLDTITKDDLDELRRDLPTDPRLAELVQLALPYPWSDLFEYVPASEHRSAYWRTSHDRTAIRSADDFEYKLRFARAAKEAEGLKGTVERDGQEIPASAATSPGPWKANHRQSRTPPQAVTARSVGSRSSSGGDPCTKPHSLSLGCTRLLTRSRN